MCTKVYISFFLNILKVEYQISLVDYKKNDIQNVSIWPIFVDKTNYHCHINEEPSNNVLRFVLLSCKYIKFVFC